MRDIKDRLPSLYYQKKGHILLKNFSKYLKSILKHGLIKQGFVRNVA